MFPCGTPKVTGRASDNSFHRGFRLFLVSQVRRKPLQRPGGETQTDDNLDIKISWSTESNAFVRSRYTAPQMFPLSTFSKTSFKSKLFECWGFYTQEVDYPGSGLENSALKAGTGYLAGRGDSPTGGGRMELAPASRALREKQKTTDFATRSTRWNAD